MTEAPKHEPQSMQDGQSLDRGHANAAFPGPNTFASGADQIPQTEIVGDAYYRELFNNARDAIYLWEVNVAGDIVACLDVNDEACRITGYSREELLQATPGQLSALPFSTHAGDTLGDASHRDAPTFEVTHQTKDGREIPVEISAHSFRLNGKTVVLSVARDISERKAAERAARASRQRLNETLGSINIGSWEWEPHEGRAYWSEQACRIFGIPQPDPSLGWTVFQAAVHPDDEARVAEAMRRRLNGGSPQPLEFRITRPSGEVRWVRGRAHDVETKNGEPIRMVGTIIDITDIRRAETTIWEQSKLLESIFNNSLECMVLLDREFNFLRVNQVYAKACGREVEDLIGRNHFDLFPSDVIDIFRRVVATKEPFTARARPFVYPDDPSRGVTYWDWSLVPLLGEDGEVRLLIFTLNDVTDRKRAEEALRDSEQRLRTILDSVEAGTIAIDPDRT